MKTKSTIINWQALIPTLDKIDLEQHWPPCQPKLMPSARAKRWTQCNWIVFKGQRQCRNLIETHTHTHRGTQTERDKNIKKYDKFVINRPTDIFWRKKKPSYENLREIWSPNIINDIFFDISTNNDAKVGVECVFPLSLLHLPAVFCTTTQGCPLRTSNIGKSLIFMVFNKEENFGCLRSNVCLLRSLFRGGLMVSVSFFCFSMTLFC